MVSAVGAVAWSWIGSSQGLLTRFPDLPRDRARHPLPASLTQVLPAARDRAKDLGIINIAIVGPAALGGGLAALLVSVGGYPTLFAATAAVAACGSIFVWKIKSVP